jgi:hypothetical protein
VTEQARQTDRPYLDFDTSAEPRAKPLSVVPPALPAIPLRAADPNEILRVVCVSYALELAALLSKDKHKNISEARQVACWLLRTRTKLSFPEIGRVVRKDHTSVMVGVKKCVARRVREPGFENYTDQLAAAVEARLKGEVGA